ncbi:MAG: YceI family protein [Anaerolineae bacterium]|nr:YceI family protein [Anaerolineae bacterium]MDW8070665.1 YceI family protein [Anaerolineae bacterium]
MSPIWQLLLGLLSLVAVGIGGIAAVPHSSCPDVTVTPTATATASAASQATPTPTPTLPLRPLPDRTEIFSIVPEESLLTYTVTQVLLNAGGRAEPVVGRTRQLAGQLTLNYADPRRSVFGLFTVNLHTLTSGDRARDAALRSDWLEFARFPLAYFRVQEVRNFPPDFQPARPLEFQLVGALTLKGITRPATWDTTAALYGDRIKGTATTRLYLADFGIPLPVVPGQIEVTDGITVTLEYTFQRMQPPPLPGGT